MPRALNCSRNTVKRVLEEHREANNPVTPKVGEAPITGQTSIVSFNANSPEWIKSIDWEDLHKEYLRGVPLLVLWEENYSVNKIPVQYPGFWKQFIRRFPLLSEVTMVKVHRPGERVEVDYSDGMDILDPATGEILTTQLFVGVLSFSRYCFAEFTFSQKSQDFLCSHVRMFDFFGGVPAATTPDNLKSAISKVHFYDPEKNPAYTRLAAHYNFAVMPARVRSPKDKAVVERTIQILQRWFFYRVRKITFTSLVELNQCLKEHLQVFHQKKHRILQRTRLEMFVEEKSYLKPLPVHTYEVHIHHRAILHDDCHLQYDGNYYSAPWNLRKQRLDLWVSDKIVEIWHNGESVAIHGRIHTNGRYQTQKNHYPPQHRAYLEITPLYLKKKAADVGPSTQKVVEELFSGEFPLQHLRRVQGIIALLKKYSPEQLEFACEQALLFNRYHVPLIENIIKHSRNNIHIMSKQKVTRGSNPYLRGEELLQ